MTVECTQTLHQKETLSLIKDFFSRVHKGISRIEWGVGTNLLYGITGIKLDKPFMAEVFEGSFTTNSLLKKYPINESQVMYIFTALRQCGYHNEYYDVGVTRVYHDGKVFTDGNNNLKQIEKYFDYEHTEVYYSIGGYDYYRQNAIKTLVLVSNKENVVKVENRKTIPEKEFDLARNIFEGRGSTDYKTQRVKLIDKEDNKYWVALRDDSAVKGEYQNSNDFEPFDKSGYSVVVFRKSLIKRLEGYRSYLRLKEVVGTDCSQELQTRYDEIIVLKNLISTNTINNTDSETIRELGYLMHTTSMAMSIHENIILRLKRSKEAYENYKYGHFNFVTLDYYKTVDDITQSFESMDYYIEDIKTKLFGKVLK